jgi:hypothetical protein
VAIDNVEINDDAETTEAGTRPILPALRAELTWAQLYTKSMHKDLVAITSAISKTRPTTAGPEMKKDAEKLHDQLQSANRTVDELSDHAGIRPAPIKSDRGTDSHESRNKS